MKKNSYYIIKMASILALANGQEIEQEK